MTLTKTLEKYLQLQRCSTCFKRTRRYYRNEHIKWPTGTKANEVMNSSEEKRGIPVVLGAIDGSHIPIKASSEGQQDYINHKRFHSINFTGNS